MKNLESSTPETLAVRRENVKAGTADLHTLPSRGGLSVEEIIDWATEIGYRADSSRNPGEMLDDASAYLNRHGIW